MKRLARWALAGLTLTAIAAGLPLTAAVLGGLAGAAWAAHLTT